MTVPAVIGTNQQVLFCTKVPKDTTSLQCLNNAHLTYLFGTFLIDSFTVPLNTAIGYLSLLNMEKTGYCLESGTFTGAVSSKEGNNRAVLYIQRNAMQHSYNIEIGNLNVI